jgi:hypothetical protein
VRRGRSPSRDSALRLQEDPADDPKQCQHPAHRDRQGRVHDLLEVERKGIRTVDRTANRTGAAVEATVRTLTNAMTRFFSGLLRKRLAPRSSRGSIPELRLEVPLLVGLPNDRASLDSNLGTNRGLPILWQAEKLVIGARRYSWTPLADILPYQLPASSQTCRGRQAIHHQERCPNWRSVRQLTRGFHLTRPSSFSGKGWVAPSGGVRQTPVPNP